MLVNEGQLEEEYFNVYKLNEKKIGIPIFQRFYDWKEKQVQALLNDIMEIVNKDKKQIYLLDFIYYYEDNKAMFADGQQRIVSINFLIKAINDYIDQNRLDIVHLNQFDIFYDVNEYNEKYRKSITKIPVAPFKKNYLVFLKWIQENHNLLEKIIEVIKNRIFVFLKKAENVDDAFAIFQQINTGGKPLSKEEIIKSTIEQYAKIYNIEINDNVKELKKMIFAYYKYINQTSPNDFDSISLMSFLKNDVVCTKEKFQDFANAYKKISKMENNPMSILISYLNRSQLYDILNVMLMKNIDVFTKREYIDCVLFPLFLLSISMSFRKSNPGGKIRVLYAEVIEKIKNDMSPKQIGQYISSFINDEHEICKIDFKEFERCLGDPEMPRNIKKAILLMDIIKRNASSIINISAINLEHIYPQKPSYEWAMKGWPTNQEKQKEYIDNIGNYLILNGIVNKKVKNNYITQKISDYDRIIRFDKSLQTEMNTIDFNKFVNEGANYISERQKQIAKMVYDNFDFAKVIITLS